MTVFAASIGTAVVFDETVALSDLFCANWTRLPVVFNVIGYDAQKLLPSDCAAAAGCCRGLLHPGHERCPVATAAQTNVHVRLDVGLGL
jgi:hypothetical protein